MTTSNDPECRDQESPARRHQSPDAADLEFAAWLDSLPGSDTPIYPPTTPAQSRRDFFFATPAGRRAIAADRSTPVLRFNAASAYRQPSLSTFLRHVLAAIASYGLTPLRNRHLWLSLAAYTPVRPVLMASLAIILFAAQSLPTFSATHTTATSTPLKQFSDTKYPTKCNPTISGAHCKTKHTTPTTKTPHNLILHNGITWKLPDGELNPTQIKAALLSICLQSDQDPTTCDPLR